MDMDEGFNTSEAECDSEDEGEGEVELCMFLDQAATIQKALQKDGRAKGSVLKPREPVVCPLQSTAVNHRQYSDVIMASSKQQQSQLPDDFELDSILGALSELECQLDHEQQTVAQATLRRQKTQPPAQQQQQLSLPLPPPPSHLVSPVHQPQPATRSSVLSGQKNVTTRVVAPIVDDQPLPPPPPSAMVDRWGDSLDVQLQDALAELSNFVGSSLVGPSPDVNVTTPVVKTPAKTAPSVAQRSSGSLLQQQRQVTSPLSLDVMTSASGRIDHVDGVLGVRGQASPVKRCLKPQQKPPGGVEFASSSFVGGSNSSVKIAPGCEEEAGGKAEMMQRFIELSLQQQLAHAANSPEADSGAFCDNFSLPSSSSRASVLTTCSQSSLGSSSGSAGNGGSTTHARESSAGTERSVRFSSERPSLLVDPKEATKVPVKVHMPDGSVGVVQVNAVMTVAQVVDTVQLMHGLPPSLGWSLVEVTPDLYMERLLEDHEYVLENVGFWTADSTSRFMFIDKPLKYDLFLHPEIYLLKEGEKGVMSHDRAAQKSLIEDFFSEGGQAVPEVEGMLYIKAEGKKVWKKLYFVLRASGLYYNPKGKGKSSKDLICLQTFDVVDVYVGVGWKKKYKSPTDYCFALKHPQIQKKAPKYIKYLCAEDSKTFSQWLMGIRLAKTGRQMLENYRSAQDSIASWSTNTLDTRTAHSSKTHTATPLKQTPVRTSSSEQAMASGQSQMGRTVSMPQVQVTPELTVISHGRMSVDSGDARIAGGVRVTSFNTTIDECAESADGQPGNKMAVARSESCLLNGEKLSTAGWRPHPSPGPSPSLRHTAIANSSSVGALLTVETTSVDGLADLPPPPSPNTLCEIGSRHSLGVQRPSSSSSSRASSESLRPPASPMNGSSHSRRLSSSSSGGFPTPPPPDMFAGHQFPSEVAINYAQPPSAAAPPPPVASNHLNSFYGPPSPAAAVVNGAVDKNKLTPGQVTTRRAPGTPGTNRNEQRLSSSSSTSSRSTFNEDLEIALSKKSATWRPEDDIVDGGKDVNAALVPSLAPGASGVRPVVNGRHTSAGGDLTSPTGTVTMNTVAPSPLKTSQSMHHKLDVNANPRVTAATAGGVAKIDANGARLVHQLSSPNVQRQQVQVNGGLDTRTPKPAPPLKAPKPTPPPMVPTPVTMPVDEIVAVHTDWDQARKKPPPPPPKRHQETRLTSFQ